MKTSFAPVLYVRVMATGIDERMTVALDRTLALGRDADCDVALPSATVSRRHLSLFMRDGRLVVRDHSSNGTCVNGEPLHLALRELSGPAALKVGPYSIALTLEEEAAQEDALLAQLASAAEPSVPLDPVLGPLGPLLADRTVREIMVLDADTLYVERGGRIERSLGRFRDRAAVQAALEQLVAPQAWDTSCRLLDRRLADGSRLLAVLPPIAPRGPCLTIRKSAPERRTLEQLTALGSLSEEMAVFLARAVRMRVSVSIVGAAGSGKTTLLASLCASISDSERVVTVEQVAELALTQPQVISLVADAAAGDRVDASLLRHALGLRADRVVVGECELDEAPALLQALTEHHAACLVGVRVVSPRALAQRLESSCAEGSAAVVRAARRAALAERAELVVQTVRALDGARRVARICELFCDESDGALALRELFCFRHACVGEDGQVDGAYVALPELSSFWARVSTRRAQELGPCS